MFKPLHSEFIYLSLFVPSSPHVLWELMTFGFRLTDISSWVFHLHPPSSFSLSRLSLAPNVDVHHHSFPLSNNRRAASGNAEQTGPA